MFRAVRLPAAHFYGPYGIDGENWAPKYVWGRFQPESNQRPELENQFFKESPRVYIAILFWTPWDGSRTCNKGLQTAEKRPV